MSGFAGKPTKRRTVVNRKFCSWCGLFVRCLDCHEPACEAHPDRRTVADGERSDG